MKSNNVPTITTGQLVLRIFVDRPIELDLGSPRPCKRFEVEPAPERVVKPVVKALPAQYDNLDDIDPLCGGYWVTEHGSTVWLMGIELSMETFCQAIC